MPGRSGYEVLEWLRENPGTAGVPVVFLTVKDTTEDQKRGLREGVVDYLSKEILTPEKVSILIYRIRNFFTWQENERLRGVLATIVSANHEINNPLMVIQGGADLIRIKGMLDSREDGLKALDRITTACRTIADVLSRITGLTAWARTDYLDGVEMLDLRPEQAKGSEGGEASEGGN
jgi:CheY-like chemotaxis protein